MAHNPSSCPHILPMINNIFHRSSNLTRVPSSISDRLSSLHEYTTNWFIRHPHFEMWPGYECMETHMMQWEMLLHPLLKKLIFKWMWTTSDVVFIYTRMFSSTSGHTSKDIVCTLVKVIITNPTHVKLLPSTNLVSNFVVLEITQIKEMNYKNQHPKDQFMPLIFKKLVVYTNKLMVVLKLVRTIYWDERSKRFVSFGPNNLWYEVTKCISHLHRRLSCGVITSQLPPFVKEPLPILTFDLFVIKDLWVLMFSMSVVVSYESVHDWLLYALEFCRI